jgi:RimJ/RimL family protein N-acetyltransferase
LNLTIFDPTHQPDLDFSLHVYTHPDLTARLGIPLFFDSIPKILAFRKSTCLLPAHTPRNEPLSGPAVYTIHLNQHPSTPCANGEPIGIINFSSRNESFPPDIGWVVLPAYQGKGYASEAARRVLEYFLNEFQGGFLNAYFPLGVTATIAEGNVKSKSVARQIGFVELGEVRSCGVKMWEGTSLKVWGTRGLLERDEGSGEERMPYKAEEKEYWPFGEGEDGRRTVEMVFGKET